MIAPWEPRPAWIAPDGPLITATPASWPPMAPWIPGPPPMTAMAPGPPKPAQIKMKIELVNYALLIMIVSR